MLSRSIIGTKPEQRKCRYFDVLFCSLGYLQKILFSGGQLQRKKCTCLCGLTRIYRGYGNATNVLNSLKLIELFEYYRPQVQGTLVFKNPLNKNRRPRKLPGEELV